MKLTHKYPLLGSSKDPEVVSMTIKGLGVWLIPMIIAIARMMGYEFVEADLTQLLNAAATMVASVMVVYGLLRKLYFTYKK